MNEQQRDLLAASALGALPTDEAAEAEEQAARSSELAAQLEEYRVTVSMLETAVARELPPANLFDGVLARIEAARSTAAEPEAPAPRREAVRERRWRLWSAFAAGAATAAAAAALAFALSGDGGPGTPDAQAAIQGTEEFPGVHGEARLYAPSRDDGRLVVTLAELPPPAAGEHYQVWVLRRDAEGEMEAVGVFRPTGSEAELEFTLPGSGSYEAVDVSVEPNGGSAEHSGRSLAGGVFDEGTS